MMRWRWVIWYALIVHVLWAVALLFDKSARLATAVGGVNDYIPTVWLTPVFFAVSVLALASLRSSRHLYGYLLVLPQQALIVMSGAASLHAILQSQYGDGVIRPWEFIAADQIPPILLSFFHTFAVLSHYGQTAELSARLKRLYPATTALIAGASVALALIGLSQ